MTPAAPPQTGLVAPPGSTPLLFLSLAYVQSRMLGNIIRETAGKQSGNIRVESRETY
ncbi:hypothetical protein ACU8KH_05716 [Lachancea thermotolerans]